MVLNLFHCYARRFALCKIYSSQCCYSTAIWTGREKFLKIHPNIRDALQKKKPVVALESTIITHGMPYPDNHKTALEVEEIVEQEGVTPATIAVVDGLVHVGLSKDDLHKLSTSKSAVKISRRGLPASITHRQTGGTTVSATILIAHRCGIPIFVTGGIGGVHRGVEDTMDISSDLTELGRSPITVISAGIKSILDIPKTMEYLETKGVSVATYGEKKDFPAFFTPRSGYKSQLSVQTPKEAAELIRTSQELNMDSGCLIAVPIPDEYAASGERIEAAIQMSLAEAKAKSIIGAEVTPYILKRVNELTGGESLKANVALIKNNASVGAKIAVEVSQSTSTGNKNCGNGTNRPVVVGATNIDVITKCTSQVLTDGPSNPATVNYALGGVGRNIVEGLARYGHNPAFISSLGDDGHAAMAVEEMRKYLDLSYIEKIPQYGSGIYNAIMDEKGSLKVAAEQMDINEKVTCDVLSKHEGMIAEAPLVCVDANLPPKTLSYICDLCQSNSVDLFYEPTGSLKAGLLFLEGSSWKSIKYLTPNMEEFGVIMSAVTGKNKKLDLSENGKDDDEALQVISKTCHPLLEHIHCLIVTLAGRGVATFTRDNSSNSGIRAKHYPLFQMPHFSFMQHPVMNVSGSGDSFAAAFIHGLLSGESTDLCTKMGLVAAQFSLRSKHAVPENLNKELFTGLEKMTWDCVEL